MADICATCANRRDDSISAGGLLSSDCEYSFTGVLQFDKRTGKPVDCEDYEQSQEDFAV